jgi:hypothetical protein
MKLNAIVMTLALGSSFMIVNSAFGQDRPTTEQKQTRSIDSLTRARDEQKKVQKANDDQTLSDLKDDRSDTKQVAKEAQRAEAAASSSAKASKGAYKTERKAQKARKHADAQAKKAAKAKSKVQ